MADKYLSLVNGVPTEIEAKTSSAGASDAGKVIATDTTGKLHESFLPTGIGADTVVVIASENLASNDLVNVFDDSGTFKARKADASTAGKLADGFVKDAVLSGAEATVYPPGSTITGLSGITAGRQYLSATTPGGFTPTPPSGSGNVVQCVGIGMSPTSLNFTRGEHYVKA
jgi:hypothetical protein